MSMDRKNKKLAQQQAQAGKEGKESREGREGKGRRRDAPQGLFFPKIPANPSLNTSLQLDLLQLCRSSLSRHPYPLLRLLLP